MGSRLGSERANVLDNSGEGNTVAEMAKASLLVLARPEPTELLDMLGLTNFVRERTGLEPEFAPCLECSTPMTPANTGHHSDGREFCRVCHRKYRREMAARTRGAA